MIKETINLLGAAFTLEPQNVSDFAQLKAGPMKFNISQYLINGVGNLSVMQAAGMFGLMKMDTVILTPLQKDAPLFSYDRVRAMGNDTLIIELYDTQIDGHACRGLLQNLEQVKNSYQDLPDHDLGSHWYDAIKLPQSASKKGKGQKTLFDKLYREMLCNYIAFLKEAPNCDAVPKAEKTAVYVNGLLSNGGPSTDVFMKALGKARTEELFQTVLFGIKDS